MKRNYVPSGQTARISDVAARNRYIDQLCQELLPAASDAYRSAFQRMAREGADVILEEAQEFLLTLAPELDGAVLDEESVDLANDLAAALRQPLPKSQERLDDALIEQRSKDLSRGLVGFWVDLADTDTERFSATSDVLADLLLDARKESTRQYQMICARFGLDKDDAWRLLNCLNVGATAQRICHENKPVKQLHARPMVEFDVVWAEVNHAPAPAAMARLVIDKGPLLRVELRNGLGMLSGKAFGIVDEIDRINLEKLEHAENSHEPAVLAAYRFTANTMGKALIVALNPALASHL